MGRSSLLLVVFIAGAALRLWGISWGLPDTGHNYSYQGDEMTFLRMLREMDPVHLDFQSESYRWLGPGLPVCLGTLLLVAGKAGIVQLVPSIEFYKGHPDELGRLLLVGRFFVVAIGIATIWLTYQFGRRHWGGGTGVAAAALVAVVPVQVYAGRFLLADVPAGFCALAAIVLLARYVDGSGGPRWYFSAIGFGLAAIAFKLTTAALFSGFAFAPFLRHGFRERWKPLRLAVAGVILIAVGTVIIYPFMLSVETVLNVVSMSSGVGQGGRSFATMREVMNDGAIYAFGPFGIILLATGLFAIGRRRNRVDALVLVSVLPMAAMLIALHITGMHRYAPLFPFLAIVMAGTLSRSGPNFLGRAGMALVVAGIAHAGIWSAAMAGECGRVPVFTEAKEWIDENIPEGSRIGVSAWHYIPQISVTRYEVYPLTGPGSEHAFDRSEYYLVSEWQLRALESRLTDFRLLKEWKRIPTFLGVAYDPPVGTTPRIIFSTTYLMKRSGIAGAGQASVLAFGHALDVHFTPGPCL